MTLIALLMIVGASIGIAKACDYFEAGSDFVGKAFPPGVRGATINAIGSSLPELLTTFCLLFFFKDVDGFSAGIATCAGSAVFNAVIIPALIVLTVTWGKQHTSITLDKKTVIRDGLFFIAAELILIALLSGTTLDWYMGLGLLCVYLWYLSFLWLQTRNYRRANPQEEDDDDDDDEEEMTAGKAWLYLSVSATFIGVLCYGLSWAVVALAQAWEVPAFLTAVVFGAAATSVPDTIISLKDAKKGDYDDAIANAIGSNIFDITVCLGLPLLVYGLVYGDVHISAAGTAAHVQSLRIGLVCVTAVVLALFLIPKKLKVHHGVMLLGLFGLWLGGLGWLL